MAAKFVVGSIAALLFIAVAVAQENRQTEPARAVSDANASHAVTGRVVVGGKPVEEGRVLVYLADGQIRGCLVSDGAYSVKALPVGTFPVSIDGPNVAERYARADSGLNVMVSAKQEQPWDFSLAR